MKAYEIRPKQIKD